MSNRVKGVYLSWLRPSSQTINLAEKRLAREIYTGLFMRRVSDEERKVLQH
jgi:hypothetical protein